MRKKEPLTSRGRMVLVLIGVLSFGFGLNALTTRKMDARPGQPLSESGAMMTGLMFIVFGGVIIAVAISSD